MTEGGNTCLKPLLRDLFLEDDADLFVMLVGHRKKRLPNRFKMNLLITLIEERLLAHYPLPSLVEISRIYAYMKSFV